MAKNRKTRRPRNRLTLTASDKALIAQAGALVGILDQRQTIMAGVRVLKDMALQQINQQAAARAAAQETPEDGAGTNADSIEPEGSAGDCSDDTTTSEVCDSDVRPSESTACVSDGDSVPSPS